MAHLKRLIFLFFILTCQIGIADSCDVMIIAFDKKEFNSPQNNKVELLHLINEYSSDQGCLAKLYLRLGIFMQRTGKTDSAIAIYNQSAKLFEKVGEFVGLASCFNQMATVYGSLDNDSLCFYYYKQAFDLYSSENYLLGKGAVAFNIAQYFYVKENLRMAEDYCLTSIACRKAAGDSVKLELNYSLMADICFDKNQLTLARLYVEKAKNIIMQKGDLLEKTMGLNSLGYHYLNLGMKEQSLAYFRESFALAKKFQHAKWTAMGALALADFYEEEKRFDSAYYYIQKYSEYKDQMASENLRTAIANANIEYESEKKELEYQSELKQKKNSQLLNAVLAVLLVLGLVSVFFLIRSITQKRKIEQREAELQSAKSLMKGQDIERERIAHELHDRVGSMLSAIKLHFGVIESRFKNKNERDKEMLENVVNLMDETYEEVRRISHDLDAGQLGKIGLHSAMQKLAKGIASTRQLKVSYIDSLVSVNIDPTVETDIYRITQELLANTIKYARASEVSIQLSKNGDKLVYSYEDDGEGFDKAILTTAPGIGYKNMMARVDRMHGKWFVETSIGNGTNVIIEIPLS